MEYDEVKTELSSVVNEDILAETEEEEESESKKELDLDSIDMMQLPIQLDDGMDILNDVKWVCLSTLHLTYVITINLK